MPTFIVIFIVAGVVLLIAGIGHSIKSDTVDQSKTNTVSKAYHTVHNNKQASIQNGVGYTTDPRYIYGKPVKTEEDLDRWYVILNFSRNIRDHLVVLENQFTSAKDFQAAEHFAEWKDFYQKYRKLIVRHRMYNSYIGVNEPFVETTEQLHREKSFLEKIEKEYHAADLDREIYISELYDEYVCKDEIINHLKNCNRKSCYKADLLKEISVGNPERRKQIKKAYSVLLREAIIGEKLDENGKTVTRFIVRRSKAEMNVEKESSTTTELAASSYDAGLYAGVSRYTILKVEETVGEPQHVDRIKNTCQFVSLSTRNKYQTSLQECTCRAFSQGIPVPCKHMIKLAMHLGYYTE